MMRLSSHEATWAAAAGPFALIAIAVGVASQQGIRRFDSGSFRILDLTLGKSEVADLVRILGPSPEVQARDPEESFRCYAAAGSDKTVLEIGDWFDTLVEFRLLSGTAATIRRCARTSRVSLSLSTGSGLKLGIDRNEVLALLGRPTKTQGQTYIYESAYDRPLTAEERRRAQSSYHSPPDAVEVYERIELKFTGPRVTLVDIVRNETW